MGAKDVSAGSYTIFTLPSLDKWTLVNSKETGVRHPVSYEGDDLAHVDMRVSQLRRWRTLIIAFDQVGGSCQMHLSWKNTRASAGCPSEKIENR